MTLQVTPYSQQTVYLPLPNDQSPSSVFITSLSFYDAGLNSYIANYQLQYSSESVYVNAFVAYPQSVFSYTSNKNIVIYKDEGIFDEKMVGFVSTALVVYADDKISANQVLSRPISGVQYVVFYNDDILIFMSSPQGVYFYSTKYNKFYNVYVPTTINLFYPTVGSVLFLGGYIYFAIYTTGLSLPSSGTFQVTATYYLMYTKFSYSDLTLSILVSCSISKSFSHPSVSEITITVSSSIVGNGSYVALVMLFCCCLLFVTSLCIKVLTYNINSSTYNVYAKSFKDMKLLSYIYFRTSIEQQGEIFCFYFNFYQQQISIYSYYIFIVIYCVNGIQYIVSFNINTGSIEYAPIPPNPQIKTIASLFMLRSNIIYIFSGYSSPVQYGNTYYLPVNVYLYQITTSEMLSIEYTQYALEKNTLILSGTVKYLQTGEPVPNATVSVYLYDSVQGHSYAVSKLLTQTTTDKDGNFQIVYKFPNSPSEANIIVTASVDPVVMEVVYPKPPSPKPSVVTYP